MMRWTLLIVAVIAAAMSGSASCGAADWTMFGFGPRHAGYNPAESLISPANVSTLKPAWAFSLTEYAKANGLPTKRQWIVAQPVVATNVVGAGGAMDMLFIGDGTGLFVALKADSSNRTGELIWARSTPLVLTACADVGNQAGILSTAAIDRQANGGRGAVYVASNGIVYAWDLATGATIAGWPETGFVIPNLIPNGDTFIFAGLTLVDGTLYVTNAGRCDKPPYHGAITAIDTVGVYMKAQWFAAGGSPTVPTVSGGGIWGPGGVAIDTSSHGGALYTATGNPVPDTATVAPRYTEAMVRLRPNLSAVDWSAQPVNAAGDHDFGSTPVPFHPATCQQEMAAVMRKSGELYVAVTNPASPSTPRISVLKAAPGSTAAFGAVAFDDSTQLMLMTTAADGVAPLTHGLLAFKVNSHCQLQFAWKTNSSPDGNPIIAPGIPLTNVTAANGLAFFGVGLGAPSGALSNGLYAVAQTTSGNVMAGQALWHSGDITTGVIGAPVVVNGWVYAAAGGTIHAYALPPAP